MFVNGRMGYLLGYALAALLPGAPVLAQDEPVESGMFRFLDRPHDVIGERVEVLSRRIDSYFSGYQYYDETTGSYARLTLNAVVAEGGDLSYHSDLRLKIRLPQTRKKYKLLIESGSEEEVAKQEIEVTTRETPKQAVKDSDYYAALRREARIFEQWDFDTDLGLRLHRQLDPFTRLKVRRRETLGVWEMRVAETLFWFNTKGIGSSTGLDFDKPVAENKLFRASTELGWLDRNDYWDLSENFYIFQDISDRDAILWQAGIFGKSQPTVQAETYLLRLRYRRRIHHSWLFFEVRPEIFFHKEKQFEPEYYLIFGLEMIAGDDSFQ